MKTLRMFVRLNVFALLFVLAGSSAYAARSPLSSTPLSLVSGSDPNVFIEMDDSGSMDWEYLTVNSWHACAYDVSNPYSDGPLCEDGDQLQDGYFHSVTHRATFSSVTDAVTGITTTTMSISGVSDIGFAIFFENADNWDGNNCASWDAEAGMEPCDIYDASDLGSLWRGYSFLPLHWDWRGISSDFNILWFNPQENYIPWVGSTFPNTGSFSLSDGDPAAMRSNPLENTTGYSMTRDVADLITGEDVGFQYAVWLDGYGFSGDHPQAGTDINRTDGSNGIVDLWDDYVRYTVIKDAGGDYALDVDYIYYTHDATTGVLTWNKTDLATKSLTDTDQVTFTDQAGASQTVGSGKTVSEVVVDIANWYQYARRRSFVAKSAVGQVVQANTNVRFGLGFIKKTPGNTYTSRDATGAAADTYNAQVKVPTSSPYTNHNDALLEQLYYVDLAGNAGRGGTPLREGFIDVYDYFSNGSPNPIANECQKHFLVAFTDGHYNNGSISIPDAGVSSSDDFDGDGQYDMLADISRMMYLTDLDGDCSNNRVVSPTHISDTDASYIPSACTGAGGDEIGDGLVQQHIISYTIAFGLQGNLYDTSTSENDAGYGWPDKKADGSDFTPAVNAEWAVLSGDREDPNKIDDMWHAAYNSGGNFFSATSPEAVADALNDTLEAIQNQSASSSAVAASTGELRSGAQIYRAFYDSTDWSGNIQAFDLNPLTGDVITPEVWDARDLLTARSADNRSILTYSDASGANGGGVAFRYTATATITRTPSASQKAVLGSEALVNYIRGDQTNEVSNGGSYRDRDHLLGDIVYSAPVYVGAPYQRFVGSSYSAFKDTHADRSPIVYVGSNDGMLHAFNAATGAEEFAYVPAEVYSNLGALADPAYTHQYYVDGSPTAADIYDGSEWKTIIVGGLNAGGKAYFALDITDPNGENGGTSISEVGNTPANVVLWEINNNSTGLGNLGYTFSKPSIAQMANGDWAMIIGNGYHSTSGYASLIILDVVTGTVIKEIVADTGPDNGLSTPTAIDQDGDSVVDYIYAGDLHGNMWKFDVTSTNINKWEVAFNGNALFAAGTDQPITTSPEVTAHPEGGFTVLFGTGKFFEAGDQDTAGLPTQAFYGIWDDNPSSNSANGRPYDVSDLLAQTITKEITETVGIGTLDFRFTSNNEPDWDSDKGWYLNLTYDGSEGERVVYKPLVRNERIIFVTMYPESGTCESGGSGWLMELNAYTGQPLTSPPFDLDGDGTFDINDLIDSDKVPSGLRDPLGPPPPTPTVVRSGEGGSEFKYVPVGVDIKTLHESGSNKQEGRRSWRILDGF